MLFKSFFWAGFEGATGLNAEREWIDQVQATGHERFTDHDYAISAAAGLKTVRDCIRWPLVDTANGYDFSSLDPLIKAAESHGIQVVWDLFHYGYPLDLDPFSPAFTSRFAAYCFEAARYVSQRLPGPHAFTPVNEPSYFSWAAGDACRFAPHMCGRSYELKVHLCKAAIKGIDAIWQACPDARIVHADPVCRIVPPVDQPELQEECDLFNEGAVFEAMDMISGRLLPELGGSPKHLDILGVNYYWTNQWEIDRNETWLDPDDPRLWSLGQILRWTYDRYHCPFVIAETSHVNEHRAPWIKSVADEAEALLNDGLPLLGVCLYPVIGMPEWHDRERWTRMGIWDVDAKTHKRTLYRPAYEALREAQERLEPVVVSAPGPVPESSGT